MDRLIASVLVPSACARPPAAVAPGLHERELDYLRAHEWACSADDVLWRRSKLGLRFTPQQRDQVSAWMQRHARSKEGAPCS